MNANQEQNSSPPIENFGYLIVRAYTAGEALPVEAVTVTISDGGDGWIDEEIVTTTNRSGLTEAIRLPAPSPTFSRDPLSTQKPFAVYNIRLTHPQYYPFTAMNIPVFSGVVSSQPVNMIPLSSYDTQSREPRDITNVENNETLWDQRNNL